MTVDNTNQRIISDRQKAHPFYWKNSKVFRSFKQRESMACRNIAFPITIKNLILTGISIRFDLESWMGGPLKKAIAAIAFRTELGEAIETTFNMGGGLGLLSAMSVMDVMDY